MIALHLERLARREEETSRRRAPMTKVPTFHDGYLSGIRLADKSAVLYVRRTDGSEHELHLVGLDALQMDDFREGNTIFEIGVISNLKSDIPELDAFLERLFPSPQSSAAAEYHERYAAFLAERLAKIESGEACLVTISSSYGANLIAYCSSVSIRTA